jgi:hypothetical protein
MCNISKFCLSRNFSAAQKSISCVKKSDWSVKKSNYCVKKSNWGVKKSDWSVKKSNCSVKKSNFSVKKRQKTFFHAAEREKKSICQRKYDVNSIDSVKVLRSTCSDTFFCITSLPFFFVFLSNQK